MKTIRTIIAAMVITIGAVSCSTNSNVDLTGEWKVITINDAEVPETMKEPIIIFNGSDNTFSGITGVNTYNGEYKIENGNISFSDGPMTKMMGDPESMVVEGNYLKALASAKNFALKNGTLCIMDEDNNVVMTLEKK